MFDFFKKRPDTLLSEHSRVRAVDVIRDGVRVAAEGSTGTIVRIYGGGQVYEVEFTSPEHVVVFASRKQLSSVAVRPTRWAMKACSMTLRAAKLWMAGT